MAEQSRAVKRQQARARAGKGGGCPGLAPAAWGRLAVWRRCMLYAGANVSRPGAGRGGRRRRRAARRGGRVGGQAAGLREASGAGAQPARHRHLLARGTGAEGGELRPPLLVCKRMRPRGFGTWAWQLWGVHGSNLSPLHTHAHAHTHTHLPTACRSSSTSSWRRASRRCVPRAPPAATPCARPTALLKPSTCAASRVGAHAGGSCVLSCARRNADAASAPRRTAQSTSLLARLPCTAAGGRLAPESIAAYQSGLAGVDLHMETQRGAQAGAIAALQTELEQARHALLRVCAGWRDAH